jgi:GntR family transcriptional regulator
MAPRDPITTGWSRRETIAAVSANLSHQGKTTAKGIGLGALDQVSSRPLYHQLKDLIRESIAQGRLGPHDRVPSEHDLVRAYGVSRVTARQALVDLAREGLLFRVQGKGSFVARPPVVQRLNSLKGLIEEMAALGLESASRVLRAERIAASVEVARRLDVGEGEPIFEIRRVRTVDGEPVSLDISFFPFDVGQRLAREDLVGRDIFWLLENSCGLPLGAADCQIGAVAARPDIAQPLGIDNGAPLLFLERLTYAETGRPLDYEHLYVRTERFRYGMRLTRRREHDEKGRA